VRGAAIASSASLKLAPAGRAEFLARADAELLQRLEAVRHKSGADHVHPLAPFAREVDQRLLGVRLEPLRIAEARLERHAPFGIAELQLSS
jgi:hypothetical protein